jgi:Membrane-associated sensor, integral membrane domain
MISTGASPTAVGLSALALLALWWRSERTALDVWLMVVMSAWLLDVILSAIISSSRYNLGWYAGRTYGFVAACCLFIVLLFEMNRLNARLTDALARAGALEKDLTFRAENDSLTGLPNRALFYDRLESAMARCRRNKTSWRFSISTSINSRRSMTVWATPPAMISSAPLRSVC